VPKGRTQLTGFNERIIAWYGQDMTTQDIRAHLGEMYDAEVSPGPDLPGHRWRAGRAGRVAVPPTDQVYPVTLHRRPDGQEPRRGWCRTGPSTSLPPEVRFLRPADYRSLRDVSRLGRRRSSELWVAVPRALRPEGWTM
jgi:hypothetical protein